MLMQLALVGSGISMLLLAFRSFESQLFPSAFLKTGNEQNEMILASLCLLSPLDASV